MPHSMGKKEKKKKKRFLTRGLSHNGLLVRSKNRETTGTRGSHFPWDINLDFVGEFLAGNS